MNYIVKDGRFKIYTEEESEQRKKEQAKASAEKAKKIEEYAKKLDDYVNKIIIAENADAAKDLYIEALALRKEAMQYLQDTKGIRHNVSISQLQKIDRSINDLEDALRKRHDEENMQVKLMTELVSLATNSKERYGAAKSKIDDIIRMLNKDYDYKIMPEKELCELKRTLFLVAPEIASRINDSTKDDQYIDVIKAVNRMMEAKNLESNYLGCNVRMWNKSRENDVVHKNVHVDMGFSAEPQNIDAIAEAVKEALDTVYEKTVDLEYDSKALKSGQFEVNIDADCVETLESKARVYKKHEAENAAKAAAQQEELKKRREAEEKARQIAELAKQIARAKNDERADALLEKASEMLNANKISKDQFSYIKSVFESAKERIKAGISGKDDSLYLKLKYESKIKNAKTSGDVVHLEKLIIQDFNEGLIDNQTFEYLKTLTDNKKFNLLSVGDSLNITRVVEKLNALAHKQGNKFIDDADAFKFRSINDEDCEEMDRWLKANDIKYDCALIESDIVDDVLEYLIPKDQFSTEVIDVKPHKNESEKEFISRFMSETKSEYPDQKQRLAVAYSYWNNR